MSALVNYDPDSPPIDAQDREYVRLMEDILALMTKKKNWRYPASIAVTAIFSGIRFGSSTGATLVYQILNDMLAPPYPKTAEGQLKANLVDVLAALDEPDPEKAVTKARQVILGNLIPQNQTAP